MINYGTNQIKRVGYGDTMVRAVWNGPNLVHPNGRSYIFYSDFYPYRTSGDLTQYADIPLSETGYRPCVPKSSLIQKSYASADDSLGVTIYNGCHQFTIQSWIVGTWLVDVLFESRNQATNFIVIQNVYGGHCRIGKGTAGADLYDRDEWINVSCVYTAPIVYTRYQFTVTKTVYDESWYILPFTCQDSPSAPVVMDIYRLTAGIRKIA